MSKLAVGTRVKFAYPLGSVNTGIVTGINGYLVDITVEVELEHELALFEIERYPNEVTVLED